MGWLSNWGHRKKITITGQSGAGSNYQIPFFIGQNSSTIGPHFD
ncbi:hypothetical protein LCGC14_2177610, partial [marine sediment metagenome]